LSKDVSCFEDTFVKQHVYFKKELRKQHVESEKEQTDMLVLKKN